MKIKDKMKFLKKLFNLLKSLGAKIGAGAACSGHKWAEKKGIGFIQGTTSEKNLELSVNGDEGKVLDRSLTQLPIIAPGKPLADGVDEYLKTLGKVVTIEERAALEVEVYLKTLGEVVTAEERAALEKEFVSYIKAAEFSKKIFSDADYIIHMNRWW